MIRGWWRRPGAAMRALPGVVLRRSGPAPALSRRTWLFDAGLALGLALLAILTAGTAEDTVSYPSEPPPGTCWDPASCRWPPGTVGPMDAPPPDLPVPAVPVTDSFTGVDWAQQALLLALIAAPLIFRRRYPLSVLWVVLGTAAFVGDDAQDPLRLSFYVGVIAGYSAAVYSPYRLPALASLPVAAYLFAQLQQDASRPALGEAITAVPSDAVPFLILLPLGIAAYGLRSWRARADAERARVTALEGEHAEAVRRAAEEERARIARELHDVVTHNVSVMVIQAGAARKVLEAAAALPGATGPPREAGLAHQTGPAGETGPARERGLGRETELAREALLSVEASGRAAMTELRHVMGLLTMDGDTPELAPQPGLAELEALVGRVRDAGLPVGLVVTGDRHAVLPDGVDLTAYRVVQEALTNTVKHARGASAVVRVDYGPDRLWIEVTDTGGRRPPTADAGSGRGLIGLRERLALYGGTLRAGPRIRGGYRVEANIPFATAPTTPDAEEVGAP